MKNFIIRTITGIIFVAAIVASFLRPEAMVLLFSIVTGMTIWEFTGLVNEREHVTVNRFICTVASVYFFYAMTYFCSDLYAGVAKSVVFIPYLVTIIYLLISELYLKQDDPIQDWAYTMLSQMYIALPFSLLNVLAFTANSSGVVLVVLSLLLCAGWNDTAYYPSTADLQSSLTIQNSCSSEFTLTTMAVVSILIPFVLAYIVYAWWCIDKEKLDMQEITDDHAY